MSDTRTNPYAAPNATIVETDAGVPARKAERSTRLLAALADGFIGVPLWLPLFFGAAMASSPDGNRMAGIVLIAVGVIGLIALVVVQLVMLARHGQTIGKRWQGIRIVRSNGERIGFGRILGLRMIAPGVVGAIPFLGAVFSLANILWIFGEERRCLHDYFADSIVVNA
ncbi:RDD family protein [Lysobacter arvi]|uniref:RDD family protein n=1 Tax=Lysobacter arvi TaxID=3038776 RepID=A0ABU1CIL1_9GAMM|nr:RDD family protein [Lysobacter arvi]MDR0184790.1 RDD family protein [Lysobacter arvi]